MAKLTRMEFARRCAFIAGNASAWASDILSVEDDQERLVNQNTINSFCQEMDMLVGLVRAALKEEEGRG